jgi:hypothetical protein
MKTQTVGSIKDFLRGQSGESFSVKVQRHFKKYGTVYKVAGLSVIMLASGSTAFASTGIEAGAQRLYAKLLDIGKWVIIFKGGFDTIKNMASGDFDAAKRGFMSYLIVYIFLLALPWAMNEIDGIFRNVAKG